MIFSKNVTGKSHQDLIAKTAEREEAVQGDFQVSWQVEEGRPSAGNSPRGAGLPGRGRLGGRAQAGLLTWPPAGERRTASTSEVLGQL